jgi:predicted NBD/HSP70 family sugar kinase
VLRATLPGAHPRRRIRHHATDEQRSAIGEQAAMRIGIDLGGTKIEIACLDRAGTIRWRRRVPTPRDDYAATVAAIAALVGDAEAALGETGTVGLGIPGTLSARTGCVKNANSVWLNGRPLREDLRAALGREPRIQNDANCLAVSESVDGAAAGEILLGPVTAQQVEGRLPLERRSISTKHEGELPAFAAEWRT